MFSAFGGTPKIEISFDGEETRQKKDVPPPPGSSSDNPISMCIFEGKEAVRGTVSVSLKGGKKVEHMGIKVEMIGQIELYYDRGNTCKFTSLVRELEPAGILAENKLYHFDFTTEKAYESYSGMNVRLNYFIRVTITRNYNQNVVKEREFCVHNVQSEPENTSIKMEVGIEDCLHIEFEYDKKRYHLNDVIMGKIYFLLVRIKIKHMELAIIRRESAGSGPSTYNESENITKFELMDGAPVKGECIPVRLFLRSFPLTPTYRSVNNTFSVKYYLNLVLVDEEDRRYFKQQEITMWRRDLV